MEKILQKNKVKTYCEHCERVFINVWICKMNSIIGTRYAMLCTGCQKLIGIYSSIDYNNSVKTKNIISNEARISNLNKLNSN
jgi:protein-arginine kinase activator protein McsA